VRAFWQVFGLEFRGLWRSWTMALLTGTSLVWMFVAPCVFSADGTDEGAREMCVRFSLGGVAALLAVTLLVSAAGSLSRERAARRLQLTMVRPVRLVVLALGKMSALVAAGACVLAVAAAVEAVRQDPSRPCSSVRRPVLPSPAEEAEAMYADYMADPATPPEVRKARKSVVMRLLTQRAIDHYQTIPTNETVSWKFSCPQGARDLAMRFRFTNMYEMRDDVRGSVAAYGRSAVVSNITQAIVRVPLAPAGADVACAAEGDVTFRNEGGRAVMLRPRKDVELLIEADGFLANLLRAYLQLVGMLALLIAFGVFLGAGLSRPVAVFVAVVALALSEMSPSVVEQYPDELETDRIDAIGLSLARFAALATHPVGALHPLSSLAADERVEPRDVVRTLLADVVVFPVLLALLAALVMPRKQDEL